MASQKYYEEETQTLIGTKRKELVNLEKASGLTRLPREFMAVKASGRFI